MWFTLCLCSFFKSNFHHYRNVKQRFQSETNVEWISIFVKSTFVARRKVEEMVKQKWNQCCVHSTFWTCVQSSSTTLVYLVCYVIYKRHELSHTHIEGCRMGVNWQFLTNSVTHATATSFKLEKILHNAYTYVECTYPR